MTNKAPIIRDAVLRSIREECGLGNPPEQFTTNASESVNALLKHKVDYKQNELPAFIDQVKELVEEQDKEVERAVINRGKYRLRDQYHFLEVGESKWCTMTSAQHLHHLAKVRSTTVAEVSGNREEPAVDGLGTCSTVAGGPHCPLHWL